MTASLLFYRYYLLIVTVLPKFVKMITQTGKIGFLFVSGVQWHNQQRQSDAAFRWDGMVFFSKFFLSLSFLSHQDSRPACQSGILIYVNHFFHRRRTELDAPFFLVAHSHFPA
jgi:hypothetical protein